MQFLGRGGLGLSPLRMSQRRFGPRPKPLEYSQPMLPEGVRNPVTTIVAPAAGVT